MMTGAVEAEIPFNDGFVKDVFAKQCEPFQRPYEFLWTGRRARVGQRTETQVNTDGGWCRLSGIVTEVTALPTVEEWTPPLCDCGRAECAAANFAEFCDCQKQQYREYKLNELGALQGQKIVSFSYLNFDFYGNEHLPFKSGRIYKVAYDVDEAKDCVWCVTKIEDVTDSVTDLPQPFKEWKERHSY